MERLAVTIPEAGRIISTGRTKIYELAQARELCLIKIGRKTLITTESIKALLERSQITSAANSS